MKLPCTRSDMIYCSNCIPGHFWGHGRGSKFDMENCIENCLNDRENYNATISFITMYASILIMKLYEVQEVTV